MRAERDVESGGEVDLARHLAAQAGGRGGDDTGAGSLGDQRERLQLFELDDADAVRIAEESVGTGPFFGAELADQRRLGAARCGKDDCPKRAHL